MKNFKSLPIYRHFSKMFGLCLIFLIIWSYFVNHVDMVSAHEFYLLYYYYILYYSEYYRTKDTQCGEWPCILFSPPPTMCSPGFKLS